MAALTHRNISVFSRCPENWPSVSVLISGGRLFHANGPATEKLRAPTTPAPQIQCLTLALYKLIYLVTYLLKTAVLVRDTTRSA